jgi:hypothetical protein
MVYQANKTRRIALEHGTPHPTGGDYCGAECFIFAGLQFCTGFGWVFEVCILLSFFSSDFRSPQYSSNFFRSRKGQTSVIVTGLKEAELVIAWLLAAAFVVLSPKRREN